MTAPQWVIFACLPLAGAIAVGGMGIAVLSRIGMIQEPGKRSHEWWYFGGLAAAFLVAPGAFVVILLLKPQ